MIYDEPINMLVAAGCEVVKDQNDKKEERNVLREIRVASQMPGQGQQGAVVPINGSKEQHMHDLGGQRVTQLCFLKSLYNQCGVIGGTDLGQVKIFSNSLAHNAFETLAVHQGEVTKIKCSPDGR